MTRHRFGFPSSNLRQSAPSPDHADDIVSAVTGMATEFRDVDPRELRVPPSRSGADPWKLQKQIAQFGASTIGMPPIWVCEAADGVLVIYNGVTRATRAAKLAPGTSVRVEVIDKLRRRHGNDPKIGDLLP